MPIVPNVLEFGAGFDPGHLFMATPLDSSWAGDQDNPVQILVHFQPQRFPSVAVLTRLNSGGRRGYFATSLPPGSQQRMRE